MKRIDTDDAGWAQELTPAVVGSRLTRVRGPRDGDPSWGNMVLEFENGAILILRALSFEEIVVDILP